MKNQAIKPIGRYEVGGASEDSCMEEYMDIDGKKKKRRKKGCGYAASQKYNQRQSKKAKRQEVTKKFLAGVGAAGAATGAYLTNIFGVKDKVKELTGNKTGGAVKKKMATGGATKKYQDGGYTNTTAGQMMTKPPMKKGGVTKKYQAGGGASIVAAMKKGGATKKKK
jgi:hypothetical protein